MWARPDYNSCKKKHHRHGEVRSKAAGNNGGSKRQHKIGNSRSKSWHEDAVSVDMDNR